MRKTFFQKSLKQGLLTGSGIFMLMTGLSFLALQFAENTQNTSPPSMVVAQLHSQVLAPALHSPLLSLKYDQNLKKYHIHQMGSQNQIISYDQDAKTGKLLTIDTPGKPASANQQGLLPLEQILQKSLGAQTVQLLGVELTQTANQKTYALDWIQEGAQFHAHFDAHSGSMLSHAGI